MSASRKAATQKLASSVLDRLALHRGGPNGENPHAHLMFSERGNDGIARDAAQWFKRHNPTAPAQGGARKSRAAKAWDWLDTTRQAWEQAANRALAQAGREKRIDGRQGGGREAAARHRPGRAGRRPSAGGAGGAGDRRDWSAAEGDL